MPTAEAGGRSARSIHMVMLRCIQVLRRLMVRNKDVGVFCQRLGATLGNPANFAQCLDFLEANRALAPSFVLEFKQATFRHLGPIEIENLGRPVAARLPLLDRSRHRPADRTARPRRPRRPFHQGAGGTVARSKQSSTRTSTFRPFRPCSGRFGIEPDREKDRGRAAVVDLLDYDVRFGQGFLFCAAATVAARRGICYRGTTSEQGIRAPNGSSNTLPIAGPAAEAPMRATGNAALARRAAGPG